MWVRSLLYATVNHSAPCNSVLAINRNLDSDVQATIRAREFGKSDDLEQAVVADLAKMRLATPELAGWLRTELGAAVTDLTAYRRRQSKSLAKRKTELATMKDRLLNAYLAGTVEEVVYQAKSNDFKAEAAKVDETLAQLGDPTRLGRKRPWHSSTGHRTRRKSG